MIEQATRTDSAFLAWLDDWVGKLPEVSVPDGSTAAVVVVDMVNGFCKTGNLASERVGNLISPVVETLQQAHQGGVRRFLVAEDTHRHDDKEFSAFPPHCIVGTGEELTVSEIMELPFASEFEVFSKPTVNISVGTDMNERLEQLLEAGVTAFVVVGDCTDLCVYQAASYLRLASNAMHRDARVIVPANAVDTYDLTQEAAASVDALPHPGEFLHRVFLYHMALLGCEVVSSVTFGARK